VELRLGVDLESLLGQEDRDVLPALLQRVEASSSIILDLRRSSLYSSRLPTPGAPLRLGA